MEQIPRYVCAVQVDKSYLNRMILVYLNIQHLHVDNVDTKVASLLDFALDRISSTIENFHERYSTTPDDPDWKKTLLPICRSYRWNQAYFSIWFS